MSRNFKFWSAVPTPLDANLDIDEASVRSMVRDAIANRMDGLLLCGTCGEGPWLRAVDRVRLVEHCADEAGEALGVVVNVTENSPGRVIEAIRSLPQVHGMRVLVAPPPVFMNRAPHALRDHFLAIADASSLPLGIYDLGDKRGPEIPISAIREICLHPNVVFVKDSSSNEDRKQFYLEARRGRSDLELFNGDEFRCLEYLDSGYDGAMFGGAIATSGLVREVAGALAAGNMSEALAHDEALRRVLYQIYGGEDINCWLSGLKYYLQVKGIFASSANHLNFPLTSECRTAIDRIVAGQSDDGGRG